MSLRRGWVSPSGRFSPPYSSLTTSHGSTAFDRLRPRVAPANLACGGLVEGSSPKSHHSPNPLASAPSPRYNAHMPSRSWVFTALMLPIAFLGCREEDDIRALKEKALSSQNADSRPEAGSYPAPTRHDRHTTTPWRPAIELPGHEGCVEWIHKTGEATAGSTSLMRKCSRSRTCPSRACGWRRLRDRLRSVWNPARPRWREARSSGVSPWRRFPHQHIIREYRERAGYD